MTILRKILRIRLILRIRIFVNADPDLVSEYTDKKTFTSIPIEISFHLSIKSVKYFIKLCNFNQ